MKLSTTLLAATLAIFAASTAFANEEHHTVAKPETVKAKKAEAKKPVKKHNHMEEKSGVPMAEPASGKKQHKSTKKMDRHDHTKDRH